MANVSLTVGSDGNDNIQGGPSADLIYGFDPQGPEAAVSTIAATRVATGLSSPLFATAPPDDPTQLFIVERGGQIEILDLQTGQLQSAPFLDISGQVSTSGEEGLLGLAFHPDFATNGLFYVDLTNANGDTEIRSYHVSATNPNQADAASEHLVIAIDQPNGLTNHKGGWLGFGPDHDLYIAMGDGGGAGDPFNNAQNTNSLLGKILRLDVNGDAFPLDPARNYAIPADNPFVGHDGADEVWAFGLRNPWRDSFDRGTDEFHIADVGQDKWEEIDIGAPGTNYGWPTFEGPEMFSSRALTGGAATPPIAFYGHDVGESIAGGYVYRGDSDGLQGQYFLGDFVSGRVWTLPPDSEPQILTERTAQIAPDAGAVNSPVSFGEDARGNLFLVDFDGDVFRLTPQTSAADSAGLLQGGGGDDRIFGGAGNDLLRGDAGDDFIFGGSGSDFIEGGVGNDRIFGDAGNDRLIGDSGADRLTGGAGSDNFVFAANSGQDVITDFHAGAGSEDVIEFTGGVFANFAAVLAASNQVGPDTVITHDALNTITLHNVSLAALHPDDFAFT